MKILRVGLPVILGSILSNKKIYIQGHIEEITLLRELLPLLQPIAAERPAHWGMVSLSLKKQWLSSILSLASDS